MVLVIQVYCDKCKSKQTHVNGRCSHCAFLKEHGSVHEYNVKRSKERREHLKAQEKIDLSKLPPFC